MDNNWNERKRFFNKGNLFPVENISWNEANQLCKKLNKQLKKLIRGYRFDLPTEAQWEFAARGGGLEKNNYKYSGSDNLDEVGWYQGNSIEKTHEVGKKKPNALGIYDMSGNVWEWCRDWYEEYPINEVTDPLGAECGTYRVRRGGSWYNGEWGCSSTFRGGYDEPSLIRNDLGFRVALVPIE